MKKDRFIALVLILTFNIIGWILFFVYTKSMAPLNIGCIDIEKVYVDFEMTKEANNRYLKKTKKMRHQIDSLDRIIKNPVLRGDATKLSSTSDESNKLIKSVTMIKNELESQVWKRLNQYIDQFAIKREFDLIVRSGFGDDIFYTNNQLNITNEIVDFVNNKYLGNADF